MRQIIIKMSSSPKLSESLSPSQQQQQHHESELQTAGTISPPSEMSQITTADVLDLHKTYDDKAPDVVYTTAPQQTEPESLAIISKSPHCDDDQLNVTKIELPSDQIYRVVEGNQIVTKFITHNGESQVISREIIDGEHHILTRNENGDHIITRIVDPQKLQQFTTDGQTVYTTTSTTPVDHISASVLHYGTATDLKNHHHQIVGIANGDDEGGLKATDMVQIYNGSTKDKQIIYTHATTGDKELMYETKGGEIYDDGKLYEKPQIDLIYEDGNKTVIYTTTADQKGLELYTNNELGLVGDGQVVVQGGIQYTQQTQGATVLVVQGLVDNADMNGQIQRYVF